MWGRRLAILLILVSFASVHGAWGAQVPSAAASESCKSFTHRYFIGSGSAISTRIGYVDTVLNLCRTRGAISNATVTQTAGTTGPGQALGFNIDLGAASVTYRSEVLVKASYAGRIRICIAQRTPLCSQSYEYEIGVGVGGPTIGDPRVPQWYHGRETVGGVHYYESV